MPNEYIDTIVELARKTSYAQSWTYLKIESDALWRIYIQQKTGVKIKIEDWEAQIIKTFRDISKKEKLYGNILEGYIDYGIKINFEDYRCGQKDIFETSEAPFSIFLLQILILNFLLIIYHSYSIKHLLYTINILIILFELF